MTWTKKHDKFALTCNLSESQQLTLRDVLRKCRNEPIEVEMDLRITNKWIGKVRPKGEFHRKTMITGIVALDEKTQGMLTIIKKYSPWVYRVLIRPLDLVKRIQRAKCESTPKPTTGNPMFSAEHKERLLKQQQQDISKLDAVLQKLGLPYDRDGLNNIWRLAGKSMDTVKKATEMLLFRHSTQAEPIENPQGWSTVPRPKTKGLPACTPRRWTSLVNCLRYNRQENFSLYYQTELPYFGSADAIGIHICNAFKIPAPAT